MLERQPLNSQAQNNKPNIGKGLCRSEKMKRTDKMKKTIYRKVAFLSFIIKVFLNNIFLKRKD